MAEEKKLAISLKIEVTQKRLQQLRALQKKMDAQKKAAETKAARAADTRRKILLGAFFLDRMQRDAMLEIDIKRDLSHYLTREDDRALFELPAPENMNVSEV